MPKQKFVITPAEEKYLKDKLEEIAKKKSTSQPKIEEQKKDDILSALQRTYKNLEKEKEAVWQQIEPISEKISTGIDEIIKTYQKSKQDYDKIFEKFDQTFKEFISKLKPPKSFEEYTEVKNIWEWLNKYGVAIILGIAGLIAPDRYGYRLALAQGFIDAIKKNDMERYERYLEQWEKEFELDRMKLELQLKQNEIEYERIKQATDIDLKTKELELKKKEAEKQDLLYKYDLLNKTQDKVLEWMFKAGLEKEKLEFQQWKTIFTESIRLEMKKISEANKSIINSIKIRLKEKELSDKELNQAMVRIEHQLNQTMKMLEKVEKELKETTDPDKKEELKKEYERLKQDMSELMSMKNLLMLKQWSRLGIQPQTQSQPQSQQQSQLPPQNKSNWPPKSLADIFRDFWNNLRGK